MITTMYDRTRALLNKHKEDVEKVAELLLAKEVITREDMINLLGKRPSGREDDMDKWLDEHQKHGLAMPPKPKDSPPPPPVDDPLPSPAIATKKLE